MFFDADRDGRVDLFVACYGDARVTGPAYDGRNGGGGRFFRNVERDGHPFFVDETAASGLGDAGWGFAAEACDADDDGDDDLYVANDFGRNAFFENRSTPGTSPKFVDIAKANGTEDEGYGMGVAWGDYDGDGRVGPPRGRLLDALPVDPPGFPMADAARAARRASCGPTWRRSWAGGRAETASFAISAA